MGFFRESAADHVRESQRAAAVAPLIVADGFVTLESSGRRASNVLVYGVDERFWSFHGMPPIDGVYVSPALAAEVGRQGGRRSPDAAAEAVADTCRIAVRPQGGRRAHRAVDARRRSAARSSRRILAAAAAGRRPRGVRAPSAHPARSGRARAGQHDPRGRAGTSSAAETPAPARGSRRANHVRGPARGDRRALERRDERRPRQVAADDSRRQRSGLQLSREQPQEGRPPRSVLADHRRRSDQSNGPAGRARKSPT